MSGEKAPRETPTLEMRLAAIEDKLARLTITEEEMAAYHKVARLTAARGGAAAPAQALSPQAGSQILDCWISVYHCYISCHIRPINIPGPIINDCIQWGAGPASSGAGFSRLGGD